ncbi:MAG: tRNA-cytidine(32) 2-sulfurtransferase [Chlamydiia bacterium]|nr:tRNA-cytidine(32) 2-sulfurtransferase [Chlamydiia bacterium]
MPYSIAMETIKSIEKQTPTKLEKKLESLIRKALYDFQIIKSSPLAIALSGGKDSLTMLYFLKKISGKGFLDLKIHALYVDGQFSCGPSISKNHISNFCKQLDVPLHVLESKRTLENLECYSCSRERRSLIFNKAKELGCKEIAFGHHKDDVLETLLLNLLHKGEFASQLAKVPMHDYGITIIRPLYYVLESEILEFAKQKGFFRLTCQCPIGAKSKRLDAKRLLKILSEEFPNTKTNLFHALKEYGSDKSLRKKSLPII